MTPELLFVILLGAFVTVTVAWMRSRERVIRAEAELKALRRSPGANADRVETTLDVIALEVERLAEGQRFVARVLSERGRPELVRPAAGRSITPH